MLFQTLRGLLTLFSCLGKDSKSHSIEGLQKMTPIIKSDSFAKAKVALFHIILRGCFVGVIKFARDLDL